ncbi:methylglyoxal reductase DkgA (fragment) [Streptomyces murinus]
MLGEPVIGDLAARYGRSPAQIVIRRHLQLGNIVIPKSVTPARIRENFDVFGFTLTAEETQALAALDRGLRTGPHPDELNCARTHPF